MGHDFLPWIKCLEDHKKRVDKGKKNVDKKQKILIVDDAFRYATTTFSSFTHEPEVVKF